MAFTSFRFQIEVCLYIEEKNIDLGNGLEKNLGGFFFGRKFDHQLSATIDHLVLIEGIESLLAFLADSDQTRLAQDREMMRNGRLGDFHFVNDLVNR